MYVLSCSSWNKLIVGRSVVLANGTTRLQIDIVRSSGLAFDMLFSSELLGVTKVRQVLLIMPFMQDKLSLLRSA